MMKNLGDMIKENMEVTVRNADGTTSDPHEYGCDSWREYWEKQGGNKEDRLLKPQNIRSIPGEREKFEKRYRCPACGKWFLWDGNAPDCFDGCHVKIKNSNEVSLYIIPLCHACNHADVTVKVPRRMLVVAPPVKDKISN